MSIDYALICNKCKMYVHLGQTFASLSTSFGFGNNDLESRVVAANFLFDHSSHNNLIVSFRDIDCDGLEMWEGKKCSVCKGRGILQESKCYRCQGTGVE